jgi:arylsulfatase A-like enzyme
MRLTPNHHNWLSSRGWQMCVGILIACQAWFASAGEEFPSVASTPAEVLIAGSTNASAAQRPNIVVILVDDLGYSDVGCYGSTFYETPNVDRLAEQGVLFTDAYAACPVCSPTRASLLTGLWPQRTGITDYIGAPLTPQAWKRNTKLLPAPYTDRLALESRTIAEALKERGYATFFAGKWHLGPEGWWPEDQGFDVNIGGIDRGGPYGGSKYFSPYGNPRLSDGPEGEHLPDRLAEETAKFIEQHRDVPFLAYLSFYSVHTPLMSRADLQKKYQQKRQQLGLETRWGQESTREVRLVQDHAVYAGMVEAMDEAVGKVLTKLQQLDLEENTLVIFTSDNGGLSTSEGWPTSNLPLRAGKGWLYEGGIREPFVVRWPQRVKPGGPVPPGSRITTPISSPDLFPTVLAATAASGPDTTAHDGIDFLPLLEGGVVPERALYWHYPHYGNQGGAPGAAIRRGPWKLIQWFEDDRWELYNLERDLGEQVDLSATEPERLQELKADLLRWQQTVGAKSPVDNPGFDPAQPDGRIAVRNPGRN